MSKTLRVPSWLRSPRANSDGEMALVDHLRELRYRFLLAIGAIILTTAFCLIFEAQLLRAVLWPIERAIEIFQARRPDDNVELVTQGVTAGFALFFRVAFVAGFILACPFWLYQLWRFIVPALEKREKKVARQFLGAAIPLFLLGVTTAYLVCPMGFAVLIGFNPPTVTNLNDIGTFLTFELRLLLVFGLAFQLPVLLVSLNRLGLITGASLGKFRGGAILICAVFAAIATPTTDGLTMFALLGPMAGGYIIAEVICRIHDKKVAAQLSKG